MQSQRDLFRALVPEEHQSWLKEHIIEIAQKDDSLSQAKRICTATFDFEKVLFLGWYVLRAEKDFGLSHLKDFYPDLTGYLTPFEAVATKVPASWVADYLQQFRRAKWPIITPMSSKLLWMSVTQVQTLFIIGTTRFKTVMTC